MKKFICEQNVAHFSPEDDARAASGQRESQTGDAGRRTGRRRRHVGRAPTQTADRCIEDPGAVSVGLRPLASPLPAARSGSGPGDRRRQRRLRDGDPHTAERHPGAVAVRRLSGQSAPSLCGRGKQSQQFTEDCREDRAPHAMSVQRYDTRGPAGDFVERYWQPINTPIRDTDGQLVFLLHHVEDVSDQVTRPSSVVSQLGS